jgi:hypothetical protein
LDYSPDKLKTQNKAPGYSMGRERRMSDGQRIPGPLDYENQVIKNMKPRAPGFSMGKRFDSPIKRSPGPGDYIHEK